MRSNIKCTLAETTDSGGLSPRVGVSSVWSLGPFTPSFIASVGKHLQRKEASREGMLPINDPPSTRRMLSIPNRLKLNLHGQ